MYIAVTAVQYPSLSLENTLCRILLNFWQNWWKQFDIQSLQLLKLSNLFNLLHLRQFRLLTQSPLVEALINPNLNLFVIREDIICQFGWISNIIFRAKVIMWYYHMHKWFESCHIMTQTLKQDHQWWRYHRRLFDYQSPYF